MATKRVIVNGEDLELSSDVLVALSLQANNIADLKTSQSNFSLTFQVAGTRRNKVLLNNSQSVNSFNAIMYRKLPAVYMEDDEILLDGILVIEKFSYGNFFVTLYSGIIEVFDLIGDKSLKDYDWSELNTPYTLSNFLDLNEANGDIIFPLVDWGAYKKGKPIDIRYQYPWIKQSKIINKILSEAGISYSGEVLAESRYVNACVSLTIDPSNADEVKENNSAKFISRRDNNISPNNKYVVTRDRNGGTIIVENQLPGYYFENVSRYTEPGRDGRTYAKGIAYYDLVNLFMHDTDLSGNDQDGSFKGSAVIITAGTKGLLSKFKQPAYVYKSSIQQTVKINAEINYNTRPVLDDVDFICRYLVLKNGIEILSGDIPESTFSTSSFSIQATASIKPSDELSVIVKTNATIKTLINVGAAFSYIEFESTNASLIGEDLLINALIPDIKAKDVLRSLANQFALTYAVSSRTLSMTMFREIAAKTPEDWSNKLDLSGGSNPEDNYEVNPRFGNYAQVNWARYAPDDNDQVGDGSLNIDDSVLPLTGELFTLVYSGSVPFINMIDSYDQPSNGNTGVTIKSLTLLEADVYNPYETYAQGELVQFGSQVWEATTSTTGQDPGTGGDWQLYQFQYEATEEYNPRIILARPISSIPDFVFGQIYSLGNLVYSFYEGQLHLYEYISETPSEGVSPGDEPLLWNDLGLSFSLVKYTDGVTTIDAEINKTLIGFFIDSEQEQDLDMSGILIDYYTEISNMLNRLKVVSCLLKLTKKDIRTLDFTSPKGIQHFGYTFYLNLVSQYQEGKSTQCTLIRM